MQLHIFDIYQASIFQCYQEMPTFAEKNYSNSEKCLSECSKYHFMISCLIRTPQLLQS